MSVEQQSFRHNNRQGHDRHQHWRQKYYDADRRRAIRSERERPDNVRSPQEGEL